MNGVEIWRNIGDEGESEPVKRADTNWYILDASDCELPIEKKGREKKKKKKKKTGGGGGAGGRKNISIVETEAKKQNTPQTDGQTHPRTDRVKN